MVIKSQIPKHGLELTTNCDHISYTRLADKVITIGSTQSRILSNFIHRNILKTQNL